MMRREDEKTRGREDVMFRRFSPALRRVVLIAPMVLSLTACEWFTDFKRQPFVTTWEQDSILKAVRGAPQGSVPRSGTAVSAMQVSYANLPFQIDTIGAVAVNPHPVTEASLANGHKYYQINCAVCHGDKGDGMGPAMKYGVPPINLLMDMTKNRTDGYIYGMMRNGRGLMPSYNRIEESDRWDVVNYLRALQGVVTGVQFATGPIAMPGVNGDKVPGPTALGPNRWVPHVAPGLIGTPGVSADAAKTGEHE
ncbi:MAG: c-type cytochrome [Gemmatimonadota bacterium]